MSRLNDRPRRLGRLAAERQSLHLRGEGSDNDFPGAQYSNKTPQLIRSLDRERRGAPSAGSS